MGVLAGGELVVEFEGLVEGRGLDELEEFEDDAGKVARDRLSQYSRRSFSSVYLRNMRRSRLRGRSGRLSTEPVRVPSGARVKVPFALVAVGVGRKDGQGDDLAGCAGGKGAVAALLVRGQIADGGALVGGVEDEVALAVLGFDDGLEARVLHVGGNLDGGDHVVAVKGGSSGSTMPRRSSTGT
jgi:hypothetical protein